MGSGTATLIAPPKIYYPIFGGSHGLRHSQCICTAKGRVPRGRAAHSRDGRVDASVGSTLLVGNAPWKRRGGTCRMVKFSRTLFIMYFSGRCLSLWMKLIMYSHMGDRWMR